MHKVQPPIKPAISSTIPNQVDDNDEDMWGNDTDDDIFNNKELESIITQASGRKLHFGCGRWTGRAQTTD